MTHMFKPLQLSPTIRTARVDELPRSQETEDRIKQRQSANIVEGFTVKLNPQGDLPFKFFCEINIDNARLWRLLQAFLMQFPHEISLLFSHIDEEPTYSPYMDKLEILRILAPYEIELTQDGFLQFGIIYQDEEYLEEFFVMQAKYIQYWGMDYDKFSKIMDDFSLCKTDDLNFIDQFPMATESLEMHNPMVVSTTEVLKGLSDAFAE